MGTSDQCYHSRQSGRCTGELGAQCNRETDSRSSYQQIMRGIAGKTAVCCRNKLGGHYGRAGLGETAAHGGHRLGGQQPVEMERKVDGVSAESGERRMTSTYQNLRVRSLIYCKTSG